MRWVDWKWKGGFVRFIMHHGMKRMNSYSWIDKEWIWTDEWNIPKKMYRIKLDLVTEMVVIWKAGKYLHTLCRVQKVWASLSNHAWAYQLEVDRNNETCIKIFHSNRPWAASFYSSSLCAPRNSNLFERGKNNLWIFSYVSLTFSWLFCRCRAVREKNDDDEGAWVKVNLFRL